MPGEINLKINIRQIWEIAGNEHTYRCHLSEGSQILEFHFLHYTLCPSPGCILPGKVKANFLAFALHPPTGKLIKEPFLMVIGDVNEMASFQYLVEMT